MTLAHHLVIFTRLPRYGSGKRRLAADIGPMQALRFQRTTLSLMLRRLGGDRRWTTWLAVTPDHFGPRLSHPGLGEFNVIPQGKGDLGRRMTAVFRTLPPGPAIIIGSDVPGVNAKSVAHGFRELGGCDAVFGPAVDGGYWAVGLRRRPRLLDPFENVRWSTQHALNDSLANLASKSVALLELLEDVDDAASFRRQSYWTFRDAAASDFAS